MRPLFLAVLFSSIPGLYGQNPHLAAADAIHHVGERATVCGLIAGRRTGAVVPGLPTFIDLGRASPAPTFTIILWQSDAKNVGDFPASGHVCVTGTITQYKGVPQMVLSAAADWSIPRTTSTTPTAAAASPPFIAKAASAADPPTTKPAAVSSIPPVIPTSPTPSYKIGDDDSLQIDIWQEPNLSGTFLVRPDGMISLVLAGDVRAAGLTPMELAHNLTQRFSKFLQDPIVSVIVVAPNSQRIYVLGEVQHAGPLPLATTMSPLQAISAAGGLTPYAKPKKIYILRGPQGRQQKIPFNYQRAVNAKPTRSVALLAGDTIVVP